MEYQPDLEVASFSIPLTRTTVDTFEEVLIAGTSDEAIALYSNGFDGTVDNISVKKVLERP